MYKQIVEWFRFPETQPPKTEWYYTTLKRTEGDKITLFESREYYDSKENDWCDMEYDILYPFNNGFMQEEIIAWRMDSPYTLEKCSEYDILEDKAWMYDETN